VKNNVPVILCDEWTSAQVKAFRLIVNRSVAWADWDEELLALELQELNEADFDLSLTGFDPKRSMTCCLSLTMTIERTPPHRSPKTRCHDSATSGFAASLHINIACFAEMPPARGLWRNSWASAGPGPRLMQASAELVAHQ
jgi:hypothetical protein